MRLRWKLFLVLLVFSLVPLGAVTLINQLETRRMGDVIAQEVGRTFTQAADGILKLTAEKSATSLANSKIAVEFALLGLTEAAEASLARAPASGTPTAVYFASDFEEKGTSPPDAGVHPAVPGAVSGALPAAGRVSFDHPSFLLAPGTPPLEAAEEIARLAPLADYLGKCHKRLGKTMLWACVSLESGLHMGYPGHGGYPAGYDPRNREWYKGAGADTAWSFPYVDAATGIVIMTATKQLRAADGSPAGVAAIDVPISAVLQVEDLSRVWTEKMRSFLVTSRLSDQNPSPGLLVIAQMDYQAQAPVWKGAVRLERMASDDSDQFARLIGEIDQGNSGYLEMRYKGVDSIWAYAPIGDKTHFLIVVPASLVDAFREKVVTVVRNTTREELVATAGAALIVIVLAILAAYFGSRNITRPILELAAAADGVSQGDFSAQVKLKTGDERDQVIDAFNAMVPRLADNLRLQESLRLATEVQRNLLPRTDPLVAGLDISGTSIYCDETGGDYFDFLDLREDKPGKASIVVGDVSGHGLYSALLMASARASLRLRCDMPGTLSLVIGDVNRQFCLDVADSGAFMTLFYLVVDSRRQALSWVRAGHDPGILYDPETDRFEDLSGRGSALGISHEAAFEENERIGIRPGQVVFVGTDGIWETFDSQGRMFGRERVYDLIRRDHALSARQIVERVTGELEAFRGAARSVDDVTLVVVKVL